MKFGRWIGLLLLVIATFFATLAWAQDPVAAAPVVTDDLANSLAALLRHGGFPAIIGGLGAWVLRSVDRWLDRVGTIAQGLVDGFNVRVTLECPAQQTGRCPLGPAHAATPEPPPGE